MSHLSFTTHEVPRTEPKEVIVKYTQTAFTDTEWQRAAPDAPVMKKGDVSDAKFVGNIVAVGKGVKDFQPGDAVAGYQREVKDDESTVCFQDYCVATESLLWHLDPEVAASMGVTPSPPGRECVIS